ncbi:BA75_02890T0 [Komagataella pastoris]|uniref:Mediator of RNA polymerase II transcription subunit 9 n=1 Tax=Komagataella pastoris TaxID=4922 RepID=A0A1B2JBC3_PICPA|nr:BA75_02890T0 [Komagataella pastoris]
MFTSQVKIPSKLGTPYEIDKDFTSVGGSTRSSENEPVTVDIDEETRSRVDQLEKEHIALTEIRRVELLPLLLDLIEELKLGKIEPKDFDNAAGRIRAQISKIRGLLDNVEGLSESSESRINKLKELDAKITRKRQELLDFREVVMKRDRSAK